MSDYDKSKRVICPECKGNGVATYTEHNEDDYGRMIPSKVRGACQLCGGRGVCDRVTTYRRMCGVCDKVTTYRRMS